MKPAKNPTAKAAAERLVYQKLAEAGRHLEAALAAFKEANALAHAKGNAGHGYQLVGDTAHYRDQVAELLTCDSGEAGLIPLLAQIAIEAQ